MSETGAYEILSQTILAVLWASAPVLAIALIVGLGIAFFQALTQVQEMTLTFVPKIAAIFLVLLAAMPFMYGQLDALLDRIFDLIREGGP